MGIVIGVAHAAFLPERAATVGRLMDVVAKLDIAGAYVSKSEKREHASIWASRLWRRAASDFAEHHVVCLNDDVLIGDDFARYVAALVSVYPDKIIALHTTAPAAPSLAFAGCRAFLSYWLTGPAYVLPPGIAKDLLKFSAHVPKALVGVVNEDNLIMHYAWHRQEGILHSVPALAQHDVSVPSSLGYDNHPMRQASVTWDSPIFHAHDLTSPDFWESKGPHPWIECPWMTRDQLAGVERWITEGTNVCSFCLAEPGALRGASGARICTKCTVKFIGLAMERPQ